MKKLILSLSAAIIAATGAINAEAATAADGNMSCLTGLLVKKALRHNATLAPRRAAAGEEGEEPEEPPYYPLLLMVSNDGVVDRLREFGVIIYNSRDNLLLTSIPVEHLEEVLSLEGIEDASDSGDMSSCLNMARPFGGVPAVAEGLEFPQGYTGRNVVVGFADIGFDAQHVAFKDAVAAIYDYDAWQGRLTSVTTPAEIAGWTTDRPDEFHATHVANILAGRYMGNQYYGVATGAEIVATTSELTNVGLLAGVEDIIAYAKKVGKPAVVNMSVSNYMGPHDGSDLLCRYLSMVAQDATICISAGNSGAQNNYASQTFSPLHPTATLIFNTYRGYNGFKVQGYCDTWASDNSPLEYRIEVYDIDNREYVYSSPWTTTDITINSEADPEFARYMTGEVMGIGALSRLNNRYNVTLGYDIESPIKSDKGDWSRYYLSLSLRGNEGVRADIYADGVYSYLGRSTDRDIYIGADGSINDMCTAAGVVAVGACNSRNTAPCINGDEFSWSFAVGNVAQFSSYSNIPTIEPLPHICAPGNQVVSALSNYYFADNPDERVSVEATVDGDNYYWWPCCGTSMSAPYVAGVFALWLEASPSLSTAELLETAMLTARRDFTDIDNPRWGAGCIDAIAGLKLLDPATGVDGIATGHTITITPERRVEVTPQAPFTLHAIDGRRVDPTASLPTGIYIISVDGDSPRKLLIK